MATIRFDIEKFDGVTNFNLWQVQMMAILLNDLNNVEVQIIKLCYYCVFYPLHTSLSGGS
ncbi:hypothetical protein Goklo_016304 [Gossypium klotzschianum]|uniref:Uncharacterized protein n=1 Tax=Gossypium klotzschianum TaxID=34286 RepID=A0A7J8UE92_9ROSI|nr:hypothetical protein [Gossypium klotzschianum]